MPAVRASHSSSVLVWSCFDDIGEGLYLACFCCIEERPKSDDYLFYSVLFQVDQLHLSSLHLGRCEELRQVVGQELPFYLIVELVQYHEVRGFP